MTATTEILQSVISSRGTMTTCGYHQFQSLGTIPIPWSYRRPTSSLSLYDSSMLVGDTLDTNSLPSSPLPFGSLEESRRLDSSLWGDADCTRDYIGSLSPSSASSGYCSESSEADALSFSSSSTDPQTREANETNGPVSPERSVSTCPRDTALPPVSASSDSLHDAVESDDRSSNDSESCSRKPFLASGAPEVLTALPLSEISSASPESTESSSEGKATSKLTTVSVPSKRSSSESSSSSSSSELISSEEAPRRRVKDDEGFIRRAACVCVNEDESKVVLISSKTEGRGWLVPGGGLESGEEEADAAVREAWEEAGITGSVKRCLGVFQIEDEATHKKKRTAVYVLTVGQQHSVFPEVRLGRVREWFPIDTAVRHLSQCKPHQMAYLRAL